MKKKFLITSIIAIVLVIISVIVYVFSLNHKNEPDLSFLKSENFISLLTQEETVKIEISDDKTYEVKVNTELRDLFIPSYEKWQVTEIKPTDADNETISIFVSNDPSLYITFYSNQNACKITQDNKERYYMIPEDLMIYNKLKSIVNIDNRK